MTQVPVIPDSTTTYSWLSLSVNNRHSNFFPGQWFSNDFSIFIRISRPIGLNLGIWFAPNLYQSNILRDGLFTTLNCCKEVNDGNTEDWLRLRCKAARRRVVSDMLRDIPPPLLAAATPLRWSGGTDNLSSGGGIGDVGVGGGGPPDAPLDVIIPCRRGFLNTVWVPRQGSLHFKPGPRRISWFSKVTNIILHVQVLH